MRESRASNPLAEFNLFLQTIWGYKLKYHWCKKAGISPSEYSLIGVVPERLLTNTLYSVKWLEGHCKAVDKLVGRGYGERKFAATDDGS